MNRLEQSLTRKFGPLPAWAYAALGGVGLYFYRRRAAGGAQSGTGADRGAQYVYQYESRSTAYVPPDPAPVPISHSPPGPPPAPPPGQCPPGQHMECLSIGPCRCVPDFPPADQPPPLGDRPGSTRGMFARRGTDKRATDAIGHVPPALEPTAPEQSSKRTPALSGGGVRNTPVGVGGGYN